jgi:NADPH-dependent 7-cyano-7-deazaguanine reductase QueF-like protein
VMSLVDRAGNPTISLNKVIVPNSSWSIIFYYSLKLSSL